MKKTRKERRLPLVLLIAAALIVTGAVVIWLQISHRGPKFTVEAEEICLPRGRQITTDMLPLSVEATCEVTLYFEQNGELTETLVLDELGEHEIRVVAVDARGKQAECSIKGIGMNVPDILGVKDIYAAEGAEIDYLSGISAMDVEDGDLTGSVEVGLVQQPAEQESSQTENSQVEYSVKDSDGMTNSITAAVHILPQDELQQMIFDRQVNCRDNLIFGVEKPYDAGASDAENLEENLDYIRPALVQLCQGTAESSTSGSGFIMEITQDKLYLVTNRHVIRDYDGWDVFFFDGTKVAGQKLGVSDEYDVGVVEVDRSNVPEYLQRQLMTVHVDVRLWNDLYRTQFAAGYIALDQSGEVRSKVTGNVLSTLADFTYGNKRQQTLLDFELSRGDSGSAIIDACGNLMSMVYGTSHEPDQSTKYWGVPLDAIVMCYEQITGRTLF